MRERGIPAEGPPVEDALLDLVRREAPARLFARDGSLWSADPAKAAEIGRWLGWLPVLDEVADAVGELETWAREAAEGFDRVVLCGMGGSSLAPLVLGTVGAALAERGLVVVDTTDPDAVRAVPVDGSLFVVSSKSGSTVEPNALLAHFWAATGGDGSRFVAVTDPGSSMERHATAHGFRRIFLGRPDIGGRFSALSVFGLVPTALAGIPVSPLVRAARAMRDRCAPAVPAGENPALRLGAILGGYAAAGQDKLTVAATGELSVLGLWLEQLLAESTGKDGTGVVPVAEEPLGAPGCYQDDRVFAHLRGDASLDAAIDRLVDAGHPAVVFDVADVADVAAQMVLWEIATAYAGAVLGIDPFDQPHVERAKVLAREALAAIVETGSVGDDPAGLVDVGAVVAAATAVGSRYLAIQAYVTPTAAHDALLRRVRLALRDRLRVATTLGYGPRYLHSTGQLHKGGDPSEIVVLQVLSGSDSDLAVPGEAWGFRALIEAQALGDARALLQNGTTVCRITLADLEAAVAAALADG